MVGVITGGVITGGVTIVESDNSTDLFEGITKDTYTIVLNSKPSSSVIVNINFDSTQLKLNETMISPIQITFTSSNWSIAQTITVEALYDNVTEGTQTKSITHIAASSDSNYNGLTIASVTVTIRDTTSATVKGSFQSGNLTVSSSSQAITLTTTVDSTKAFVICNSKYANSSTNNFITCQLNTAGTQVTIQTGGGGASTVVDWYVMEYSSGAMVQRGATNFATTDFTLNASLTTSVSTTKTFVIASTRSTIVGATADGNRTVRARLTSSTNLELSRNETGGTAVTEWQVVQFDGSKVQSGTVTLSNGNTSTTATLSNSVNLNSSFLIFNYKAAAAVVGVERDFYVRGSYANSSTLSFNRVGNSQDMDISWFAIEMVDRTTVQSGSATMLAGGGTTTNSTLSNPVTTTKSMIIFSNDTSTDAASIPDFTGQDSGTYTATFVSSTQVNFTRNIDEMNGAIINWFVVSFQ